MRIKVIVKTPTNSNPNRYIEISQKEYKSIIGAESFKKYMQEFKSLVQNNDPSIADFKMFERGYVFYFEKV